MALSVKMALLTCLGFISGMCWLVSRVARPMVEMPTPLIVRGPTLTADRGQVLAADTDSRSQMPGTPARVAGRFARPSPVEVEAPMNRPDDEVLALVDGLPRDGGATTPPLPPPYVPEAPVLAKAEEPVLDEGGVLRASDAAQTESSIPEATVSDATGAGPRLLEAAVADAVTAKSAPRRAAQAAEADDRGAARVAKKYTVKRGDTLVQIMRRQWNSDDRELMNVLLAANPQVAKRPDRIFAGEVLRIPDLESSQPAPAAARAESGARAGPGSSISSADARSYTIRKRDSLVKIARRMLHDERRWREIARLNQMRDPDKILPGMRIKLPPVDWDT